jgi:ribonucleoside-diphosphate reductase beta chain
LETEWPKKRFFLGELKGKQVKIPCGCVAVTSDKGFTDPIPVGDRPAPQDVEEGEMEDDLEARRPACSKPHQVPGCVVRATVAPTTGWEGACRRVRSYPKPRHRGRCHFWEEDKEMIATAPVADEGLDEIIEREDGDFVVVTFRNKTFRLNKEKARERREGKKVINGLRTAELNVMPLKYHEAYRIYKQMKANHWEPDVIDMTKDCTMWNSPVLTAKERWIIEMGVGYFSAAEGIVGDSVLHVIEDNLTAAELKHASLRWIAEESIHMDSLLHIIGSLNIDQDEVTAKFNDIPSIRRKNEFITRQMPELKMGLDLTKTGNKKKFAKAIFGISQVLEGTQFYGLFAMILSLHRQNKMTGVGQMFQYTLRDESNHIALGRFIFSQLVAENPDIWTNEFKEELRSFMEEGVALEKEFVKDCLPEDAVGMTQKDFLDYVDFNADRRLISVGLEPLSQIKSNPFLWLDEVIFLKKEKNFFETRVTEYQTGGSMKNSSEDDLI